MATRYWYLADIEGYFGSPRMRRWTAANTTLWEKYKIEKREKGYLLNGPFLSGQAYKGVSICTCVSSKTERHKVSERESEREKERVAPEWKSKREVAILLILIIDVVCYCCFQLKTVCILRHCYHQQTQKPLPNPLPGIPTTPPHS